MAGTPENPYPDERDTTVYAISRRGALMAIAGFMSMIALPALLWHLSQLGSGNWAQTPVARLFSWRPGGTPLLDHLHATEKDLDKAGYATALRQSVQKTLITVAHEGNRKVFPGAGDWMHYQPELIALTGYGPLKREPFSVMKDPSVAKLSLAKPVVLEFAAQLKERGVPLLLIPLPVKPMIYPETISAGDFKEPLYHPDQKALYDELRAAGMDVLDLAPEFWNLKRQKQVFLFQDTHWTPDAMKFAAELVIKHLRKKYPDLLPKPEGESPIVDARVLERESLGDLVHLLDLRDPDSIFTREPETLVSVRGLDPDPKSPITLLGDSFVNIFDDPQLGFENPEKKEERLKAGFAHQLSVLLNRPLDVLAVNGGGATAARVELARRYDDEVRAKKLVIWAIASRDLILSPPAAREANVEWRRVEFNPKTSDGAAPASETGDGKIIIEAKLTGKSKNQDVGGSPYTEAMHTAVYEIEKVVSGEFKSEDWYAVQWTFRKKQMQPTAGFAPGKRYRLTLVPFDSSKPEFNGVNLRDDFEIEKISADRWFVESAEEIN